jgi:hypothetical protein
VRIEGDQAVVNDVSTNIRNVEAHMDEKLMLYNDNDAGLDVVTKRKIAVKVALELIRTEAMSGSGRNSLDSNLRHPSDYADLIQQALIRSRDR